MQQQQYGGAIAAYRRAIQLSPYEAQSYVSLSKVLQKVGETETADLATASRAIRLARDGFRQGAIITQAYQGICKPFNT